jgi:tRNA dimethylallyltransferase
MQEVKTPGRARAVLIAGPTASGKSALALRLAERLNGVVINADSMQVYGDLRVITARPTPGEERRAPHRLYGHADAAETYSAGCWLVHARREIAAAGEGGRVPIVAGGTGLYFKLLTGGLTAMPPIPAAIRTRLRARVAEEGAPALHAELASLDPTAAERILPGDRTRVVRALEVFEATGRPLHDWHAAGAAPALDPDAVAKVFLSPDRDALRAAIDTRFDRMLADGAIEEVRALASRGLDPALPAMKAHGVPWLIRDLRGEIGIEEARAGAQGDTRRYAKRQFTWFRHQLPDWPWLAPEQAEAEVMRQIAESRGA